VPYYAKLEDAQQACQARVSGVIRGYGHYVLRSFLRCLSSAKAGERESTWQAVEDAASPNWIPAFAGVTGISQ
jgi:hypothetical protein